MNTRENKTNQQKIADNLNISRTTVSRCFTNHTGVNPETRALVFSEAEKIGYNYLKSRTGKKVSQKTIGVIICTDYENMHEDHELSPGFHLMPGISEFALINDIVVDINIISPGFTSTSPEFEKLIKKNRKTWNGVLLIYPFKTDIIKALKENFPCVSLVEQFGDQTIDCVDVDHHKGLSTIINKLIEKGHKRIGYLTRSYAVQACWSYRRYSAFTDQLIRKSIPLNEADVVNVYPDRLLSPQDSIKEAIKQTKDGVTAWVCAADHVAYDLIKHLEKAGIKVPKDVSVVGFDGISSPLKNHKLSTIKIPHISIGYNATKRLYEIIKNPYDKTQLISIKGEYFEGNTL
ncbi:MAG: LacI family DNA-binding transcriptional regulator [Opitutae bacterium]|nr:LacI family DNA-binding transcriptional regulator [Opitutae bacterium]